MGTRSVVVVRERDACSLVGASLPIPLVLAGPVSFALRECAPVTNSAGWHTGPRRVAPQPLPRQATGMGGSREMGCTYRGG